MMQLKWNSRSGISIILWLVLATALGVSVSYANTIKSVEEAVDRAGKQRMITQRLLKSYAMLGMGMNYANPAAELKSKISLFDQTLADLSAMSINADVNQSLAENQKLWEPIKRILELPPSKDKAKDLQNSLEKLLQSCHKTTGLISKASGTKAGEIVNISGRQRMLSQRMASLYMLKSWGIKEENFHKKLTTAMDEFAQAQKVLEESQLTTPAIADKLKKVKKAFSFFKIMANTKAERYSPFLINKMTERILHEMDAVTHMYVGKK